MFPFSSVTTTCTPDWPGRVVTDGDPKAKPGWLAATALGESQWAALTGVPGRVVVTASRIAAGHLRRIRREFTSNRSFCCEFLTPLVDDRAGVHDVGNAGLVTPDAMPSIPVVDIRNVLVPLDGSELSLQAMPTARVLAQRFDADLHTVTVAAAGDDADRARALASAALGVPMGDDRVWVVTEGEPAEVIASRTETLGSCVVCLATHGRGRLGGALVGSVARSLLQRSPDPVVALGPSADNPRWSPRPRSWPEPLSVPRMVACVDGSTTSEQILPVAAAWARALDMSLTIVTVIEDAPAPLRPAGGQSRYGGPVDAESYVEQLVQQVRTHLPDTDGEVVPDPTGAAGGIRVHLDRRPAGLVALTTNARSGMQRVLLGATAAGIVHASVAPCLVVPVRGE
jgi:nucleotide-binding universal stress UspA family protein